jgi:CheY-like chemotaxis protein
MADVTTTVVDMLGLLKVTVSPSAKLVTDLDENLPAIKARPAQLRQVVMNLVVNASDALKGREGLIRVSTRCVTVGHDSAGGTWDRVAPGQYVELKVLDTGIGMAPETQARVFDPFFTTKSAGRGLGLPVVHGIVKRLNGTICVCSELTKGTTFQVLLPCAESAHSATADTVAGTDEVSRLPWEATVLIVEDEHPLRVAVTKMLSKAGFKVLEVGDGLEAIKLLQADSAEIDVILLDMTIPGPSSDEVLAEAKRLRPKAKVVLTSAYSEAMAKSVLTGPQVRGFVRKPFQVGTLLQTLRNVLSSQATA